MKKAKGKKKRDKDDVALDTFAGHIEFLGIKVHNFGGNTIEPGCELCVSDRLRLCVRSPRVVRCVSDRLRRELR